MEKKIAQKTLEFSDGYMISCFIGIGRPAPDAIRTKQIEIDFDRQVHWNKS